MHLDITLSDLRMAQTILAPYIITTPVLEAPSLLTPTGHSILLKAENLQRSGSFKMRGASYGIAQLTQEQRRRGIIAYSTSNHAQAVAAQFQQIPATIVMSPDAPALKVERTWKSRATIGMQHMRVASPNSRHRTNTSLLMALNQNTDLVHRSSQGLSWVLHTWRRSKGIVNLFIKTKNIDEL
jgi:threonine dehydratase